MFGGNNKNKKRPDTSSRLPVETELLSARSPGMLPPGVHEPSLAEQWAALDANPSAAGVSGSASFPPESYWRSPREEELWTPPPTVSLDRAVPKGGDPTPTPPPVSGPAGDPRLRLVGGRLISSSPRIPDILPHDSTEFGRLNFQHHLLNLAFKKPYLAPIEQNDAGVPGEMRYFLDVGCGTGTWCQDMARLFADAAVCGIDPFNPGRVSDRQYLFREGNVLEECGGVIPSLAPASFDYIHVRDMALAIPGTSGASVVTSLERLLKPGGWLEWCEFAIPTSEFIDSDYTTMHAVRLLGEWVSAAGAGRGLVTNLVLTVPSFMQRANLFALTQVEKRLPMSLDIARANPSYYEPHFGSQAERIGKLTLANWMQRMAALRPMILSLHLLGCSPEEFDKALAGVPTALANHAQRGGNCFWPVVVVYAQKTVL